jgi:hypothetical protein
VLLFGKEKLYPNKNWGMDEKVLQTYIRQHTENQKSK